MADGPGQSESGPATSTGGSESGTDAGLDTTADADTSSDSGVVRPTVCPTFFDTFDDGAIDPRWRQSFPASTSEVDDELVIAVTGELNDEYVTMVVLPEDGGLEGATMRAELGTVPVELGVRTALWVQPTMGAGRIAYNLASRDAGLRLEARITPEVGSPQIAATLDWNPDTMSWLQLRETGGMLSFETSSDGVTFELFHQMPTPFEVDSAEVGFAGHNDLALPEDIELSVRTFEFVCG
ncbi:MAG: hypothetical protein K0V04_24135 [Deltaproteobacteria bacterium]|nr:hypothetical protein [Deltaproteobacteria bacterium]